MHGNHPVDPHRTKAMKALVAFSIAVAAMSLSGLRAQTPTAIASNTAGTVMPVVADVMAETPTGAGDPDAMVCRAPQHMAGSGQLGPQLCLHNSEWWKLAANGKDIAPDGETLIDRPTVANPTGEGDPEAVTCRTPKFVMLGPLVPVCRLNRFWAEVIKNHQQIDAWGQVETRRSGAFGELSGNGGNAGDHDSGQASQSSATP
jgi:hypothetical protein